MENVITDARKASTIANKFSKRKEYLLLRLFDNLLDRTFLNR